MPAGSRELDAAGITEPSLRAAYTFCRELHAGHGRSYFAATRLLPPAARPHVHALYGFARYADDIVDSGSGDTAAERLAALRSAVLADEAPRPGDEVAAAIRHTAARFDLPRRRFADFLDSMRADLTVTDYPSYADLERYMWGSAATIGLLVLPILGTTSDVAIAEPYAADLGVAFQLTNFLRDVGEDLRRGRIYLPGEDLAAYGVDRARLARGVVDGPVRRLLAHEIARTREIYRAASPGIRLLRRESRPCVDNAARLYEGILDEIERADYQVLDRRVTVGAWRRAAIGAPALARAVRPAPRRGEHAPSESLGGSTMRKCRFRRRYLLWRG